MDRTSSARCPRTTTERLLTAAALSLLLCAATARAQDACDSDLDCDNELVCMRIAFGVDCDDAGCVEVREQGFCSDPAPEPLRCDDSNACPTPLYCDTEHADGPLCAYVEPMCSTDDDECPAGFMCVDLEPLGGCELCEDTEDGITCTAAPCAENTLNVCSPIPMSCDEDADCEDGFVCGEVGPFDLQTGWDETLVGTQGCLSIGLVAVTDGVVQGGIDVPPAGGTGEPSGGSGGNAGSAGSGGGAGNAGASGNAAAGEGGAAGNAGAGAAAAGGDAMPSGGGGDGGCSVREGEPSRSLGALMLLALLTGALLLRRWPIG